MGEFKYSRIINIFIVIITIRMARQVRKQLSGCIAWLGTVIIMRPLFVHIKLVSKGKKIALNFY